jgi:hypothetical protein
MSEEAMKRSAARILTTHTGSLPWDEALARRASIALGYAAA